MKAYTPHHPVLPGCFALVSLLSRCLSVSVAWCFCPPKAELPGVELFRSLSILELSYPSPKQQVRFVYVVLLRSLFILKLSRLLKTARIYFSLIRITLVSGNFTFTGIRTRKQKFDSFTGMLKTC